MNRLAGALVVVASLGATAALAQSKGSGSGSGSGVQSTPGTHQQRAPTASQPDAGQPTRAAPGLSDREIADLEAGRGMGLALPAERNGYPGPMHVLELADALKLTPEQRVQVQATFDWMKAQAEGLGHTYIEAETALADAFRERRVDAPRLAELIKAVEAVRSELRQVHLSAHIETATLLTDQQKAIYEAVRGYVRAQAADGKGLDSGSAGDSAAMCGMGSASGEGGCCCGGAASAGRAQCGGGSMSCAPRR